MSVAASQHRGLGADPAAFQQDWTLTVVLRTTGGGPVLTEEPVSDADLAEARSEAWLNGFLRRGHPDVPLEAVEPRMAPVFSDERCIGFALRAQAPGSEATVHTFGVTCLAPVAQRASTRLLAGGMLGENDTYSYELKSKQATASPGTGPQDVGSTDAVGMQITTRRAPLRYASVELGPLLAGARTVGVIGDTTMPVLFSEPAHEKSRHYARKGADRVPPVETGSILIGELAVCPESGEMFVAVHDAIEVADAEQREFSLIPSSKTWTRVQSVLNGITDADPGGTKRLVGQSHGHNFVLDGEPCARCATAVECGRTTVFVSTADRTFMRTVFAGQPFALCWIAGSNARGEEVATLFTLRAGVLQPRGYHVVESFPTQPPTHHL
jgi:hypothetical protein